jgi:restriction endonuclease
LQREVSHEGLHKHRLVKGRSPEIVDILAEMQSHAWNERWAREQARQASLRAPFMSAFSITQAGRSAEEVKDMAAGRTAEYQQEIDALEHILTSALEEDHAVDWSVLAENSGCILAEPTKPREEPTPRKPDPNDPEFEPKLKLFPGVFSASREKERERVAVIFEEATTKWSDLMSARRQRVEEASSRFRSEMIALEVKRREQLERQAAHSAAIEAWKNAYLASAPETIPDYCRLVLADSEYPDSFPHDEAIDYIADSRTLVVDYTLPDVSAFPTVKELKFIASRKDFLQELHVSEAWLSRTYDSVLYQIALRTLYELFQADEAKAIDSIVFNGWVNSIDKATGKEVTGCVLSLQARKTEFMDINLANVDPKACFRRLKGVSAARLTALQPIRPILHLNREDKRFVPAYGVADGLDGSSNLAAMNWEDFEHLIRELFEKEFSADGSEVKITQASRDGGVDAIVFDPDPIHGGKIVIQAKRYSNTVSVSAVRDLFGTVHNEGANKGILVTTADYGPDAYGFAKGKPLTLISGSELLYLLAKHGHNARIDLKEARLLAAEHERPSRSGDI